MPTNFLWSTGTGGLASPLTTPLTLMSTELASLAASTSSTSGIAVSAATGSSGVFTSTWFGQAVWGELMYSMGSPGSSVNAMGAGSNIAGWWLTSQDGVTFESTLAAPPRAPDFIIPFPATTIAPSASPFKSAGLVRLPALNCRVMVQNNSTNTLGGSSSPLATLKLAPVAMQY